MAIKIKLRPGKKAMVRFNNQVDENYFVYLMVRARDEGKDHPKITIKGVDKEEIPPLPKPSKPPAVKVV